MAGDRLHNSSVMQNRVEPNTSLDFFPTPKWATRALFKHCLDERIKPQTCWEPACGEGHMIETIKEYWPASFGSDVHDYGKRYEVHDFLMPFVPAALDSMMKEVQWVITNPPFRLAQQIIERGLEVATEGVAVLVRTSFLEGQERFNELFNRNPPTVIAQFAERVPMFRGRLDKDGSTATSYCWLMWSGKNYPRANCATFNWIPPCRRELEKPGDWE